MDNTLGLTIKFILSLCAGSALLAGCTDELTSDSVDAVSDGSVIVDYTVSESVGRAVSFTPQPAHVRIKSLTYLLYSEDGELLKKREIPGIAEMREGDWPMRRATMSWAQREALKDTLNIGEKYKAVFVANASPELFGGEEVLYYSKISEGVEVPVKLGEMYLSLPQGTAFDDHNMFYLCVRDIAPLPSTDREHHVDCPVMLQRIVCRTDFLSDVYPAWDTDFSKEKIRAFTDKVYADLIPVSTSKNPLHVNDMLASFTLDFAEYCAAKGFMAIPTFPAWEADFARNVNNLDCTPYLNNISEPDASAIKELLYQSCRQSDKLRNLWLPWKGLSAKVAYSSRADRFYPADKSFTGGQVEESDLSPMLDIVEKSDADGKVTQYAFSLVGFGENDGTSPEKVLLNRFKEVRLYGGGGESNQISVLPVAEEFQIFADCGANDRVQLEYIPIGTLSYNKSVTDGLTYRLSPVNLREQLPNSLFISPEFVQILQDFFKTEKGKKYGEGYDKFILEISLPDLSRDASIIAQPEWRLK